MIVSKIDIIGLREEPGEGWCEADLRLHVEDESGICVDRTHLHCSTRKTAGQPGLDMVGQLISEARRQIGRMPEHLLGQRIMKFAERPQISYAA